ncbi:hypothetical protein [Francisella frigiditurris]|uniref:Uncharacterized protein n=1 Tax=Francisella frigiditurris TaxID=1542390 RepID=A0A1J0KT78_9GAMM|nr:hypothetical protein [Francisella frigiditurris]APC96836.1 hypothetical protein KX01_761 [Francisella frigiditurris]
MSNIIAGVMYGKSIQILKTLAESIKRKNSFSNDYISNKNQGGTSKAFRVINKLISIFIEQLRDKYY